MMVGPATRGAAAIGTTAPRHRDAGRLDRRSVAGPRSSDWRRVAIVEFATVVGFVVLNVDPDALGLPSVLPLSSLTWVMIIGAWVLPASLFVDIVSVRPSLDGATAWLLSLLVVAACSALWSVHPERSLAAAAVSITVLLGAWSVTTALGWESTCRLLSVALLVVTLGGLLSDAVSGGLIPSLPDLLTGSQRFAGLTYSPTDLGRIAAFGVVVSAVAATHAVGRARRLHVAATAIAFLALVSSGTRLVVFVLIAVGVIAAVRRRSPASVVVAALAATALVTVLAFPSDLARSVARPGEPTTHVLQLAGRTPIWSTAMDLAADRPVLGYGWVSNEVVFREAFLDDTMDFEAFTAHNMIVGVLIDLGAVGATLLLLALLALWRGTRRSTGPRLLLVLVLLTGTIEATLSRPSLTVAVLGVIAAAGAGSTAAEAGSTRWETARA